MGRYYNGDIDGKFWFAVQSSDAANRFGVTGCYPGYLEYYFRESDLDDIKKGIRKIKNKLGPHRKMVEKFFENRSGYNDSDLKEYILKESGESLSNRKIRHLLKEYADLELGNKILKCVEEHGECSFEAEL